MAPRSGRDTGRVGSRLTSARPSAQLSQVPQTESRMLMCPVEPDLTMATRVLGGSRRKAVPGGGGRVLSLLV